jgi:hypothetical protein
MERGTGFLEEALAGAFIQLENEHGQKKTEDENNKATDRNVHRGITKVMDWLSNRFRLA